MQLSAPRICCLDLDTFFVSVERLLDPSLHGLPVVVGALPGGRGVVTSASYEVRAYGVRSGMPIAQAVALAPQAVFLPTRHSEYSHYSSRVRELAANYSPLMQIASIDELYLDFTGCERLYRRPGDHSADETILRTVWQLTDDVERELGLPSSAGIAANKPVSKVACGLAKPRGVLMVPAGQERDFLAPLPVRKFPGIGPVAEAELAKLGVTTLGELAVLPAEPLGNVFGIRSAYIRLGVAGLTPSGLGRSRPAFVEHDPAGELAGSISNERTFREDVRDPLVLEAMLCGLCERVCWRARKREARAGTVSLKLRYADFQTVTRSRSVAPTNCERTLIPVVKDMFRQTRVRPLPIRLLGLTLSRLLRCAEQQQLFLATGGRALMTAVDAIRQRHGFGALKIATSAYRRKDG